MADRSDPPHDPGLSVDDAVFARFRDLIYREAGIALTDMKKALLVGRLAGRLRELGLPSLESYYAHRQRPGGRRRAQADARPHLHQRDPVLPRRTPVPVPGRARVSRARRAGRGGSPETRARVERRLLHRRGAVFAGHGAARPLSARGGLAGGSDGHRPVHQGAARRPGRAVADREGRRHSRPPPEGVHAQGHRPPGRQDEGRPRDPVGRDLRSPEPERRHLPGARTVRLHLLPQRAHLLRSAVEDAGGGAAARSSCPRRLALPRFCRDGHRHQRPAGRAWGPTSTPAPSSARPWRLVRA